MSCYFCNSLNHLSHKCNNYESDKSRQKLIRSKHRCQLCLSRNNDNLHTVAQCEFYQKCFVCFSKEHHSVFCPDRLNVPNFSIPKIDVHLFPRLLQTFNPVEQYSLVFLIPKLAVNSLQPLKIMKSIPIETRIKMDNDDWIPRDVLRTKYYSTAKTLILENIQFSPNSLFYFLSYNIQILDLNNLSFTSNVKFSEIIQRIPIFKSLLISSTNVEMEDSWPDALLKYHKGMNARHLRITIKNFDFNVQSLFNFMKKQSNIDVFVSADINVLPFKNFAMDKNREAITRKLFPYFVPSNVRNFHKRSRIIVNIKHNGSYFFNLGTFLLNR